VAVGFTQRADQRVAMLAADLAVLVAVPLLQSSVLRCRTSIGRCRLFV
jgi:hypothetical protein